jgi:hypothetical protein
MNIISLDIELQNLYFLPLANCFDIVTYQIFTVPVSMRK